LPAVRKSKQANNKIQSKKKPADQSLELKPELTPELKPDSKPDSKIVGKTVVSRTAKRRGYSEDESIGVEDTVVAT
jgi:hypothetical protein